jgi:hypothetical protein
VVERLPGKCKALNQNPKYLPKKKKKRKKKKEEKEESGKQVLENLSFYLGHSKTQFALLLGNRAVSPKTLLTLPK